MKHTKVDDILSISKNKQKAKHIGFSLLQLVVSYRQICFPLLLYVLATDRGQPQHIDVWEWVSCDLRHALGSSSWSQSLRPKDLNPRA